MSEIEVRVSEFDWEEVRSELSLSGFGLLKNILSTDECFDLITNYENEALYRSKVIMSRHNFGRGEYQYFSYPLPNIIEELRNTLFERLSVIASQWSNELKKNRTYPLTLSAYLIECLTFQQYKPTPLILKYKKGDYNCLHQDIYGEEIFPLQVAICLSESGVDFTGGEFVLTHQRPRMQSTVAVIPMRRGDAVIFAVNERPCAGKRAPYKVKVRHGVSKIQSGNRYVLGLIFHDAS
ncbi:MAG: 2OG-Fe(II) oxygenase [Sneathiella sp.]|nr:2OG-Fe(II) oxygenase [Sneathiella sp.]